VEQLALDAAEQGLRIIGQRWAIILARQFLDDPDFRTACPHEPLKLARYDWIIFPPPHLISAPFATPPRLVNLPPVRIDPRVGAWMPPRRRSRPLKLDAAALERAGAPPHIADPAFLAGLMDVVQAMVDDGQKLNAVLHGIATELAPVVAQRGEVEALLYRAWDRHRAWVRRERERQRNVLHDLPRRYRPG
jgi:hypothetical protein